MGWWWWSNSSTSDASTTTVDSAPTSNQITSASQSNSDKSPPLPETASAPTREQQAFNELKDLFGQINPEAAASAASRAKTYADTKPEVDEDSLYPSIMSCSQCFDLAYYCSSVGGQANNIYRYGGLRSCSELWAQWRFCMRTKAMNKDTAAIEIRKWNQKKVAKYKTGKSSEDIWTTRKDLPPEPFTENPDDYISSY